MPDRRRSFVLGALPWVGDRKALQPSVIGLATYVRGADASGEEAAPVDGARKPLQRRTHQCADDALVAGLVQGPDHPALAAIGLPGCIGHPSPSLDLPVDPRQEQEVAPGSEWC